MVALPRTITAPMPDAMRPPADHIDASFRSAALAITGRTYDDFAAELDETVIADVSELEPSPSQRLHDVLDALREAPGDLHWFAHRVPQAAATLRVWAELHGLEVMEHSYVYVHPDGRAETIRKLRMDARTYYVEVHL